MSFEDNVYSFLSTIPRLLKLVQSVDDLTDIRIYAETAPQKCQYPYIVFCIPDDKDDGRHMRGGSTHKKSTIEIDVWATIAAQRGVIGDILYDTMHGLQGIPFGTNSIQSMTCLRQVNMYEPPINSSDQGKYRKKMIFNVFYFDNATPTLS